jgi:hypothetical protein
MLDVAERDVGLEASIIQRVRNSSSLQDKSYLMCSLVMQCEVWQSTVMFGKVRFGIIRGNLPTPFHTKYCQVW